ncbi:hypothetical protein JYQ62_35845 [Nostoc sp. UHCC 0702]|nr:hypothetical protein JYQ62_35845 [Nostoc sp. UHCC 0702]
MLITILFKDSPRNPVDLKNQVFSTFGWGTRNQGGRGAGERGSRGAGEQG